MAINIDIPETPPPLKDQDLYDIFVLIYRALQILSQKTVEVDPETTATTEVLVTDTSLLVTIGSKTYKLLAVEIP